MSRYRNNCASPEFRAAVGFLFFTGLSRASGLLHLPSDINKTVTSLILSGFAGSFGAAVVVVLEKSSGGSYSFSTSESGGSSGSRSGAVAVAVVTVVVAVAVVTEGGSGGRAAYD